MKLSIHKLQFPILKDSSCAMIYVISNEQLINMHQFQIL
jgi:hypothetical protein